MFVGIGILVVCLAVARLVRRMNGTLDEVDRQIGALSAPVVETLGHVGGIADSADAAVAKLGTVVGALEVVADGVGSTAKLATDAVAPAVVNLGAILAGLTAGLRRLVGVPGPSAPSAPNGETALHG
ncbi:MAG: hypothetical protein ABR975_14455 [Vulcanimicrobiaceae bacterium]